MTRCFVMQPFDKGKFEKRYRDVFEPAIKESGVEPYRVDQDSSVSIPINEIESGIRDSELCFADVTLDNPNVWFELGYAIASGKELCLVCSSERQSKYPFDIHHRNIIRYGTDSSSDYQELRENITSRINGILSKQKNYASLKSQSPVKETKGLSELEIFTLTAIMENRIGTDNLVPHHVVLNEMEKLGYNRLGANLGMENLKKKDFLTTQMVAYLNEEKEELCVTQKAIDWMLDNIQKLNLKSNPVGSDDNLDDEIPF